MLLPSLSAAERFVTNESNGFTWIQQGKAYPILVDLQEDKGVLRAVANLQTDAVGLHNKPRLAYRISRVCPM
jgi:hypothetical protein